MPSSSNPPRIEVLPIELIHPHEEYDPQILLGITNSIRVEGVVHDPLLVETDNFMILDGTHRYWALMRLGCPSVPVALYDYRSDNVKIGCWYRCVDKKPDFDTSPFMQARVVPKEEGLAAVEARRAQFSIVFRDRSYVFDSKFNIFDAYRFLSFFEYGLSGRGHKLSYDTERDAMERLDSGEIGAILAPPPITKEEAIRAAITGRLFPKKSTRHIIPSRPMGLDIPLEWLRKGASSADSSLRELLAGGDFKKLSGGAIIDGRRYEEEVYIFEPRSFGGGFQRLRSP
ncbi:MAG: hypothetical protein FJZ49_03255 [Candidatus Verstraetearchaeota archaeon]|nr:hypothetical protein [Candidatus Verstraetearchaeota archaeon]